MLSLLEQAITALSQQPPPVPLVPPTEPVVYVQPVVERERLETHTSRTFILLGGNGSLEVVWGLLLVMILLSGLWVTALLASHREQPHTIPDTPGVPLHAQ